MAEPILTRLNLFISTQTAKKARIYAIHTDKDLSKFTEEALEAYMKLFPDITVDIKPGMGSRRITPMIRRKDDHKQIFELQGFSTTNGNYEFINGVKEDGSIFTIEGEELNNYEIVPIIINEKT